MLVQLQAVPLQFLLPAAEGVLGSLALGLMGCAGDPLSWLQTCSATLPTCSSADLAADLFSKYFAGKLAEFSSATNKPGNNGSSDEEEEEADAMDVCRAPQPAVSVMGAQWAQPLQQILAYLQQLGLHVSP